MKLILKKYKLSLVAVFIFLVSALLTYVAVIPIAQRNNNDSQNKTETIYIQRRLEELKSLPYVSWSQEDVDNVSGVIRYNREKSYFGYNLYTDNVKRAFLMDMEGKIVHEWRFPNISGKWEHAELLNEGQIVALCVRRCLCKLDQDSNIIWKRNIPAHHDIEVLANGSYLVPIFEPTHQYNSKKVNFETIINLSEEGVTDTNNQLRDTEIAKLTIQMNSSIATDPFEKVAETGRFVLMRDNDTVAGGVLHEEIKAV